MKSSLISFFFICFSLSAWAQLPLELGGLELWMRGDSAMDIELNRISEWYDLSGNDNHMSQSVTNFKPNVEPDAINGHRGARFNGNNQRMVFPEINNIRSVVWIILEDDDASGFRPVLGHSINYPFFRGSNGAIWHDEFANSEVLLGNTRLDFQNIDGTNTDFESGYHLMNLTTTGDVMANQFGQDRELNSRWKGVLVELMIFSQELTQENIEDLEAYLVEVYSPEFTPLEDVNVSEGFCLSELQASEGFESYTWSTGEENQSIEVNQSGWYWVDLKDQLGHEFRDSVLVNYPGNLQIPQDSSICVGNSFNWDLELDDSYAITWSNGQEGPLLEESEEHVLSAVIIDENGCATTSTELILTVDSLDALLSIGENENLCLGNILSPSAEGHEFIEILWNDSEDQDTFEVLESGEIWVQVNNPNGCIGRDTLDVNIIGAAPELDISLPLIRCDHQEFQLEAIIDTPDGVEEISWINADVELGNAILLDVLIEEPGELVLELFVQTDVGCSNQISEVIEVFETPELGFSSGLNCAFSTSQWIASSTLEFTDLQSLDWQFEGSTYSGIVVNVDLEENGFSDLILSATSLNGCYSEATFSINVLPIPELSIGSEGNCLSDLVQFSSDVLTTPQTGTEVFRQWDFGDFGVSSQENPLHLYTTPGDFEILLEVETENGCSAQTTMDLSVFENPSIDLPSLTACVSVPIEAEYSFSVSEDPLASFEWEVEELGDFNIEDPVFTFENSDFYSVTLNVETEHGCRSSASTVYTAFDLPVPDFSFTPEIGLPPLEISFINETVGATQYDWSFGDAVSSILPAPFHTYEEVGTYDVTLTATNAVGCFASSTQSILIDQPLTDLVILDMICTKQNGWVETSVLVFNNSNHTSASRNMLLRQNSAEILEVDPEALAMAESKWYTFSALHDPEAFNVLCVEIYESNAPSPDVHPEDNENCKAIETRNFEWLEPFPSPFDQQLNIRFNTEISEEFVLTVTDLKGRLLFESSVLTTNNGFQQYSIDSREWLQGMYVLNYTSDLRQFSSRIIKK